MCTSITLNKENFLFGRNMDLDYSFGGRVTVTPRNFPLMFRCAVPMTSHYAMIGMTSVLAEDFPLYAEAANEKGLCMAGLDFPFNAYYPEAAAHEKEKISPFEIIPWVLGQCADVESAVALLSRTITVDVNYSSHVMLTPMHWHIADKNRSVVAEPLKDGMRIHENPVGVMTNNPPFEFHMADLCRYANLVPCDPESSFSRAAGLRPFSGGLGSVGLPGDFSSSSRFVKAAYLRHFSVCGGGDSAVMQMFHLLDSVAVVKGSVISSRGKFTVTDYSCCIDPVRKIYYLKSYENSSVAAVRMTEDNADGNRLIHFRRSCEPQIGFVN